MKRRALFVAAAFGLAGWAAAEEATPLLTFAAIADIQYADKEPGGTRHYRASIAKLRQSAEEFNRRQPAFAIHLGDLTDGQPTPELCRQDIATIAGALQCVQAPWKFVLGNHDTKAEQQFMADTLGFREFHYEFAQPGLAGWRFVVLDGNDAGYGVFSGPQLDWFRGVLARAKAGNERVICFCHYPLLGSKHAVPKPQPLLQAMDEAGCVVAWICGHDHAGGYLQRHGVHHLILHGVCETKDQPAAAIMRLFPDRLSVTGSGREPSRELPFAPATNAVPAAVLRPAA